MIVLAANRVILSAVRNNITPAVLVGLYHCVIDLCIMNSKVRFVSLILLAWVRLWKSFLLFNNTKVVLFLCFFFQVSESFKLKSSTDQLNFVSLKVYETLLVLQWRDPLMLLGSCSSWFIICWGLLKETIFFWTDSSFRRLYWTLYF